MDQVFSVLLPPYLTAAIAILFVALAVLALIYATDRLFDGAHRRRLERCNEVRIDVDFARSESIRSTLMALIPIVVPQIIEAWSSRPIVVPQIIEAWSSRPQAPGPPPSTGRTVQTNGIHGGPPFLDIAELLNDPRVDAVREELLAKKRGTTPRPGAPTPPVRGAA